MSLLGFLRHNFRRLRFDGFASRLLVLAYLLGTRFDGTDLECGIWNAFAGDFVAGAGFDLWRDRLRHPGRGW